MSTKPQVLVTRCDFPQTAVDKLRLTFDVDVYEKAEPIPQQELLKRVVGKDGVLCMLTDAINGEVLQAAGPSLKVVSTMSVGFDHINMEEVKRRGIKVGYTPDVLTDATAELTVGLLLSTSRRLLQSNAEVTNGGWMQCSWSPVWMLGTGLAGSTVGIFGLGKIGQAVMQRLAGFNVSRFLYTTNTEKKLGSHLPAAQFVGFETLLKESDFIVVTASLNDSTRGRFDRNAFTSMKKSAIFINSSRGALVDQDALVWALKEGEIRAAGLDVMMPEPLPVDHVLTTLPNCSLLPHIGSAELSTRAAMADLAADNLIGGLTTGGVMKKQLC